MIELLSHLSALASGVGDQLYVYLQRIRQMMPVPVQISRVGAVDALSMRCGLISSVLVQWPGSSSETR